MLISSIGYRNVNNLNQLNFIVFYFLDVDECLKKPCDENGHCTNTDGSFTCECNTGYSGDGFLCIGKNCFLFVCARCRLSRMLFSFINSI